MPLFSSKPSDETQEPALKYTVLDSPQLSIPVDDNLCGPLSEKAVVEVRKNHDAHAQLQAQANIARLGRELDHADQALEQARDRFQDAQTCEEKTAQELASTHSPRYVQTMFYAFCAAIALGCEYVFSYQTLPPLLGLKMDTWQAMAVGGAPVAAAVAIEMILDRVLTALDRARRGAALRWLPVAAFTILGILAVSVLFLNAEMVWKVAVAREEASRLLTLLAQYADKPVEIDQSVVAAAILAVSFVVVINAAVLLQTVMRDFHNIGLRIGAARRLRQARRAIERAREDVRLAKATFASAHRAWEQREDFVPALTGAFRSRGEFLLQRLQDRNKSSVVSLDALIGQVLASAHVPADVSRSEWRPADSLN